MKWILISCICASVNFNAFAQQNLIHNFSVEDVSTIPNSLGLYSLCEYWWKPYVSSTDLFTNQTASTNGNWIPNNSFGNQETLDGNYYLGINIFDYSYSTNNYTIFREDFCGGKFLSPLIKGQIYQFYFWINKAEKCEISSNALDLILTYDTIIDVENIGPYGYKIWSQEDIFEDTINWVKISTCFRAKGNEKAFAIGNFHDTVDVILKYPVLPTQGNACNYIYLDNFSLIECPTCCPDQFPNEEQVLVHSNPSSENNPAHIQIWLHPNTSAELEIYDYAGRLVDRRNYTDLLNNFIFDHFAAGMYYFVLNSSDGLQENGKVLVSGF